VALRPARALVVRLGVRGGVKLNGRAGLLAEVERFRALRSTPPAIAVRVFQPAGLAELIEGKIDMVIECGPIRPPGLRCDGLAGIAWAAPDDVLASPEGGADCPEVAALRDWLLRAPAPDRPFTLGALDKAELA